jgi:hypothetical protein
VRKSDHQNGGFPFNWIVPRYCFARSYCLLHSKCAVDRSVAAVDDGACCEAFMQRHGPLGISASNASSSMMFGILIAGPARIFCDNQGVVKNTSVPESVLSKKHNAVNYHAVREAAAAKILVVGREDGTTNLADLFTKSLRGEKWKTLLSSLLFNF